MKSHFKKILSIVLVVILIFCYFTFNVSAANIIIQYWEESTSGTRRIYLWNRIPSTVYVFDFDDDMPSSFDSGVSEAIRQWNSAFGSSMTKYDTNEAPGTYNNTIKYYGGPGNYLNQLGIFDSDMTSYGIAGSTQPEATRITSDVYIYNGVVVHAYLYSKAHIGIVDLSTNSNLTTNYNFTCTHEMGHALGWYGHSVNSGDVMQSGMRYAYTLTNRDKRHVTQFYNYGGTLK